MCVCVREREGEKIVLYIMSLIYVELYHNIYSYIYPGHQYRSAGHPLHPGGGVGVRGHLQAGGEGAQSSGTEVHIKIPLKNERLKSFLVRKNNSSFSLSSETLKLYKKNIMNEF